jgi:diguanylate cyclase (GGDEF)-like protein
MNEIQSTDTFFRSVIDYPMDLAPDEIISSSRAVNTLLKNPYLLATTGDTTDAFNLLFDLASDIVPYDISAFVSDNTDGDRFELTVSRGISARRASDPMLRHAVDICRFFGKAIILSPDTDPRTEATCAAWNARSIAVFPLRKNREFMGALVFGRSDLPGFTREQVKLLWFLSLQAENHLLQAESIKALSFYSFLDPLTRLYNRRYFDNQIEREVLRSQRTGKPLSLLMIDLDGFKAYNDRYHHTQGDVALQEFATIPLETVRDVDTVSRFGGDEFAVILVESDADGAREQAQRIIDRFRNHPLPGLEGRRTERLSASIGVASFPRDAFDKTDLFAKADQALYIAKSRGGGKVCVYRDIEEILSVPPVSEDIPIQKVYDAARSVVDMDKFLEILLFTAMRGMDAERGSIVAYESPDVFTLQAAIGFVDSEERLSPGTPVAPGAIMSWVVEHRSPLLVSGEGDLPIRNRVRSSSYKTDSFLSIPLEHAGNLVGTVHLTNRLADRPFTQADLDGFRPIADELARVLSQSYEFRGNVRTLSQSLLGSLNGALEFRYPFMAGHGERVASIARRVGESFSLSKERMRNLENAALFHDIGIIGIPGAILTKERSLSHKEIEITRKHPFLGATLLEGIPGMSESRRIVLEHHELFNGTGYPGGLSGNSISLEGRILSAAEYFDSITSERPHRGGLTLSEGLQMVTRGAGSLFDPHVVEAMRAVLGTPVGNA